MQNISAQGIAVRLVASSTFPQGITLTTFADDADALDFPTATVANATMGLNGDLVIASAAAPIPVTLNLVPNSEDDRNMAVLLEANRSARGKRPARDVVTMSVVYPDGRTVSFVRGAILTGNPALGAAASGRLKTRPYGLAFEDKQESR